MKKFWKKIKKFASAKRRAILLGLILAMEIAAVSGLCFKAGQLIFQEAVTVANEKIAAEQMQHKEKAAQLVQTIDKDVSFLQEKHQEIQKKKYVKSKDKKEIFDRLENLEKQAVMLESELKKYNDDHSIQFYNNRDKKIDEYFSFLWSLPLKTERAAHTFEELIFTNYISSDQIELARRALSDARWHLDETKISH